MRALLQTAFLSLALAAFPAFAHHMADGIVDEDVYAMIDELIADTPHADMTLEDLGGMTEITVTAPTMRSLENMIDDGLLDYASMLDGDVKVTIEFGTDNTVVMTIMQTE